MLFVVGITGGKNVHARMLPIYDEMWPLDKPRRCCVRAVIILKTRKPQDELARIGITFSGSPSVIRTAIRLECESRTWLYVPKISLPPSRCPCHSATTFTSTPLRIARVMNIRRKLLWLKFGSPSLLQDAPNAFFAEAILNTGSSGAWTHSTWSRTRSGRTCGKIRITKPVSVCAHRAESVGCKIHVHTFE